MFHQATDRHQELAFREGDAFEVALLRDSVQDRVVLNVRDGGTGEWFVCGVDHTEALDAFRRPFASAASLDLDHEPLSDPFPPTATLRELVKLPARQIQRSRGALSVWEAQRALREGT